MIKVYFKSHHVSPVTGKAFHSQLLVPNHSLKNLIQRFYPQHILQQKRPKIFSFFLITPIDLISLIFGFLDIQSLLICLRVCKEWNSIASHSKLWERLCYSMWPHFIINPVLLKSAGDMKRYVRLEFESRNINLTKQNWIHQSSNDPSVKGIRLVSASISPQ